MRDCCIRQLTKLSQSPSLVENMDRYFDATLDSRNPSSASTALVSAHHLFSCNEGHRRTRKNEGQEVLVVNGKSSSSFFGGCTSTSSYNPCRRRVTSRSTTPYVFGSNLEAAQASRDENDSAADRSFAGTVLENTMTLCQPFHFAARVVVKNPKYVLQRWQGEFS